MHSLKEKISSENNISKSEKYYERKSLFLLGLCFFLVIGGYTLAKEVKDFAFISIVGLDYLPVVKMILLF